MKDLLKLWLVAKKNDHANGRADFNYRTGLS